MLNKIFLFIAMLFVSFQALGDPKTFDDKVNSVLSSHYSAYQEKEYFSGISLSIYIPNQTIKDYYIGQVAHEKDSRKIDADTLFQIGSITKSFTAAIILQLEKENKLHLQDTLGQWLPEYNKWSSVTIQSLLNMTSGLPNYSDAPLMNAEVFNHPERQWTDPELIHFVYPPAPFAPPLKPGYFYSNTGYILLAMMIEKITQHSFQTEIENRLIKPAQLENTFYPVPDMDKQAFARLAHGYGYNQYIDPELVGKDIRTDSLSWAAAAGAVIANSTDVIKWVKALFVENKILDAQQKHSLMQSVSTATGEAITETSSKDPHAFGLGVVQAFDKDMGRYWFYEGETEGFRALYMYVPSTGIIISSLFNSTVNSENDHAGALMKKIYKLTRENLKSS